MQAQNINLHYEENPWHSQPETLQCHTMAINSKQNLLLVGCGYNIKIYEILQDGNLVLLQYIQEHKELVLCLIFLSKSSKSNSFISIADNIIIWEQSNSEWQIQKQLITEIDKTQIKSLAIHPQEDLIICGSLKYIQFWFLNIDEQPDSIQNNQQEWICKTQEYANTQGLSLNEKGDKLVQCSFDKEIKVFEGSNRKEWICIRKIETNQYGLRLCFITNDIIAFQERGSRPHEILYFYSINSQEEQNQGSINVKGGDTPCNSVFPLIYVPSKSLIIDRNGYTVNIITIEQGTSSKYEAKKISYFDLKNEYIYGTVSVDGNLLIIWNDKENKIELRRYIAQN